jgi:hypothetical protein
MILIQGVFKRFESCERSRWLHIAFSPVIVWTKIDNITHHCPHPNRNRGNVSLSRARGGVRANTMSHFGTDKLYRTNYEEKFVMRTHKARFMLVLVVISLFRKRKSLMGKISLGAYQ